MIACTENCKYQKNGECTYEEIHLSQTNKSNNNRTNQDSNCAYFEQE